MTTVAVTGGSGYLGSVLVPYLIENGYNVIVIDRFFFGDNLKDHPNLTKIKADIRNYENFENCDVVMDLAAISNDPAGSLFPQYTWQINCGGRLNIAKSAKKHKVPLYILASTASVYGFNENVVDEDSPTNPLTTYAKANLAAEKLVSTLADDKFKVIILRQATLFGYSPRMRFDLIINQMVRDVFSKNEINVYGDGYQWRPFLHVKDSAIAFEKTIQIVNSLKNKEIFNTGVMNLTIYSIAQSIAYSFSTLQKTIKINYVGMPDHRSYRINCKKFMSLYGSTWQTYEINFEEIYNILKAGIIDPYDPKTNTVEYYTALIKSNNKILENLK